VISQVQTKSGIFISVIPRAHVEDVVMMLIDPMIEEAPMMCRANIPGPFPAPSGSTAARRWSSGSDRAAGTKNEETSSVAATGSSQKLQLFMRANAMSGAPIIIGTCQFAKPTNAGMIAEDHDEAVHRRQLVEELGMPELQAGLEQLGANARARSRRPGTW